MWKVDHHPILDDLTLLDLPEIHVPYLDPFAGGQNAHEFSGMRRDLCAERRHPFTLYDPRFIGTDLVRKCGLEWTLPIVLKLLQTVFGAASGVSHPAKRVGEECPDSFDQMIVQAVHHAFDGVARLVSLRQVVVFRHIALHWASTTHESLLLSCVGRPELSDAACHTCSRYREGLTNKMHSKYVAYVNLPMSHQVEGVR